MELFALAPLIRNEKRSIHVISHKIIKIFMPHFLNHRIVFDQVLGKNQSILWFCYNNIAFFVCIFLLFEIPGNIAPDFISVRGRQYLVHEGQRFCKARDGSGTTYWRCAAYFKLNCLARIISKKVNGSVVSRITNRLHSHKGIYVMSKPHVGLPRRK